MKKLIGAATLLLLFGCGSGGKGEGELLITSKTVKLEQDLVCCSDFDSNTQTCNNFSPPPPEKAEFTVTATQNSGEIQTAQELVFQGCTVEVVPNPNLPSQAKEASLLERLKSYIICSADDIPSKGSASAEITYDNSFTEEIRSLWQSNPTTYTYTIVATLKYTGVRDKTDYSKEVKVVVSLDNFIKQENDACQY